MNPEHRSSVKTEVNRLVERLAKKLETTREAVADVAFLHIQKHPSWGRNPSEAQKRASLRYWKNSCQGCGNPVSREEAVFHHLRRRVPDQHAPENLLPYHPNHHDRAHTVKKSSLSKGSPVRARKR